MANACVARGVPASLLLTDRNPKSVDLARRNASALHIPSGNVQIDVARFAFGDDASANLPADFATPDVVVVSDVLYSRESAVPLARTLRQLLRHDASGAGESVLASPADRRQPACYLAWRPRSHDPGKTTAVKAFMVECGACGLSVHEASRSPGRTVSTVRVWEKGAGNGGWSQTYDPAAAARDGSCPSCGGEKLVVCAHCDGSMRILMRDKARGVDVERRCPWCNEVGMQECAECPR